MSINRALGYIFNYILCFFYLFVLKKTKVITVFILTNLLFNSLIINKNTNKPVNQFSWEKHVTNPVEFFCPIKENHQNQFYIHT